jgi:hypothetical protein
MDVDTAFLNAPINEDIWVQVPKGTELPVGDIGIYKLKKFSMVLNKHHENGIR